MLQASGSSCTQRPAGAAALRPPLAPAAPLRFRRPPTAQRRQPQPPAAQGEAEAGPSGAGGAAAAAPPTAGTAAPAPAERRGVTAARLTVGLVTALTEGLRVLGVGRDRYEAALAAAPPEPPLAPGDVAGVMRRIGGDFENAYFVTGVIDSGIYDEDCRFVDPTVQFSGLNLWKRNLALLTPFLRAPRIDLLTLSRLGPCGPGGAEELEATWALETWLGLLWRPRISIQGTTRYTLNPEANRVVKHVETWDVTAGEALLQLFKPAAGPPADG